MLKPEIFVLNYNGRSLLLECLPSIIEAAKASPLPCPVTVIDNRSSDDSAEIIKTRFPDVRFQVTKKNVVLCAFNKAACASESDIIFLLNNDLKADRNFIEPLLKIFEEHEDAFMA